MAYDSLRGRTVLFGGLATGGLPDDTWEWDGNTWTLLNPATHPRARVFHVMAYDSQRGCTVLFGGVVTPFAVSSDTWEWDGTTWTQRFPANSPSTVIGSSMVFDSLRGRTVLVGPSGLGGVWEWDGVDWSFIPSAAGPLGLSPAMAYDAQRGRTVLFGGAVLWGSIFDDTWEWDGFAWLHLFPAVAPSARAGHVMVFDAQMGSTVMFGDSNGAAETWAWDGSTWTQPMPLFSPPGRSRHAMAYDSMRGRTVLFGGHLANGDVLADTWEGGAPTNPATAQPYGTGCGSPPVLLSASAGSRPVVGQSQISRIDNASLGFALVAWGLSKQSWGPLAIPVSLDPFGFEGCQLWQSAEQDLASPCTATGVNSAQHVLPIPILPGIKGLHVYLQAWTLQPGFNTLGFVLSNALDLTIGDI